MSIDRVGDPSWYGEGIFGTSRLVKGVSRRPLIIISAEKAEKMGVIKPVAQPPTSLKKADGGYS